MQSVGQFCPRTLKVLVKKGGRRIGFEVDMWRLKMLMRGHWEGVNEEGMRRAEDGALMVREELADLMGRFEEVFENEKMSVAIGRCKVLGEEEGVASGASKVSDGGGQEGASSNEESAAGGLSGRSSVGAQSAAGGQPSVRGQSPFGGQSSVGRQFSVGRQSSVGRQPSAEGETFANLASRSSSPGPSNSASMEQDDGWEFLFDGGD